MKPIKFVLVFVLVFSACTANLTVPDSTRLKVEFLTRDGCKNTDVMLEHLKQGIANGEISAEYTVVQLETLPADDPRVGYPTPTVLLDGKDVFGLPVPVPPFPEPS